MNIDIQIQYIFFIHRHLHLHFIRMFLVLYEEGIISSCCFYLDCWTPCEVLPLNMGPCYEVTHWLILARKTSCSMMIFRPINFFPSSSCAQKSHCFFQAIRPLVPNEGTERFDEDQGFVALQFWMSKVPRLTSSQFAELSITVLIGLREGIWGVHQGRTNCKNLHVFLISAAHCCRVKVFLFNPLPYNPVDMWS